MLPDFPRRRALVQLLEALLVLERVHALPETGALVGQQGLLLNQPLKGLPHQFLARLQIAEDLLAHHEEATVDPNVAATQRANLPDHALRLDVDNVKTRSGLHQQQRSDGVALPEGLQHGREWDIAQAVAVVREKHVFALQVGLDRFEPLADVGVGSGLHEGDRPVVDIAAQQVDLLPAVRPDKIVGDGFIVVQEVVLDDVALVAEAENEVLCARNGRSTSSGARESAASRSAP